MKIAISIAVMVGAAAVAIASPVASPDPPKPMMDDDVGTNVANVGKCPVRPAYALKTILVTDGLED